MWEGWYPICLSLPGTLVVKDAKFAPASTSDRPLLKNAMTLVVSQTWQNCHSAVGAWLYCWNMPTTTFVQGRIGQRKRTAEEPPWHPWDSWEACVSQHLRWSAAQLPCDGCWWWWACTIQLKPETNHCRATYEIFDCGASRATCDPCFCRASAETCWFAYSQRRVRFQVEQKCYQAAWANHHAEAMCRHYRTRNVHGSETIYSPQYMISRKLLYKLIPHCANTTILTIDYPTIMDRL